MALRETATVALMTVLLSVVWVSEPRVQTYEDESDIAAIVMKISEIVRCTPAEALDLLAQLEDFMLDVESSFQAIASETREGSQELIDRTVRQIFEGPDATVQVSSLARPGVRSYTARTYLTRLSRLHLDAYTKIEIFFHPSYFLFGRFERYVDPRGRDAYELSVGIWQIFTGYSDMQPYTDATHKSFRLVAYPHVGSTVDWEFKIRSVVVRGTLTISRFKKMEERWRLEEE